MLLSGVLLLHWLGRLTFWRDEWDFLLHRRPWTVGILPGPVRRAAARHPDPDLQDARRHLRHGLGRAVPGGGGPALPRQRRDAVHLRPPTRGRVARAGGRSCPFSSSARPGTTCSSRSRWPSSAASRAGSPPCSCSRGTIASATSSPWLCCSPPCFFFDLGIPFVAAATVELAFGEGPLAPGLRRRGPHRDLADLVRRLGTQRPTPSSRSATSRGHPATCWTA